LPLVKLTQTPSKLLAIVGTLLKNGLSALKTAIASHFAWLSVIVADFSDF